MAQSVISFDTEWPHFRTGYRRGGIVMHYGGEIWAKSELRHGSLFVFALSA